MTPVIRTTPKPRCVHCSPSPSSSLPFVVLWYRSFYGSVRLHSGRELFGSVQFKSYDKCLRKSFAVQTVESHQRVSSSLSPLVPVTTFLLTPQGSVLCLDDLQVFSWLCSFPPLHYISFWSLNFHKTLTQCFILCLLLLFLVLFSLILLLASNRVNDHFKKNKNTFVRASVNV